MSGIVERIPRALQVIFGCVSDEAARTSGFIKRERGFSGSEFVRTLVFGWLGRPGAPIESLAERLGISGSALQQRLTREASQFLRLIFTRALEVMFSSRSARIPLLAKFNGVYVEDCTTISLPAALANEFPGCGGSDKESGKAALRLFTSYELKTGTLQQVAEAEGRGSDAVIARVHAGNLPRGALRIRDLGFFDRQLFEKDTKAGVYWISRLPVGMTVRAGAGPFVRITDFLATQPENVNQLDRWLGVGQDANTTQSLWCRLMAIRCSQDVAARRRQKLQEKARRKGRTASQRQLQMCDWTVLITNVPEKNLSFAEAWELYCSRWQIELLYKRWKGLGGLQVSTRLKPGRVLCELYAKLIGMLVAHWFTLIRGGPLEGFSISKGVRKIQDLAGRLADALRWPERLAQFLDEIVSSIYRIPKQPRRKKRPSTRQRLFQPRLPA
jgi:hypothetical protein